MRLGRLALSLMLAGGTAAAQVPDRSGTGVAGSRDSEISSLAQNLDNVVKLCGELAVRAAMSDTTPGRLETATLARGLLKFTATPPPALAAAAGSTHGAARFGRWFDPHATIWIIGFEKAPTCRVLVTDSEWAAAAVPMLEKLVQVGDFWKPHPSADPLPPGLVRSVFTAESATRGGVVPWLTITSAPGAKAPGKVQLTLSVSLVSEAKK